MYGNDWREGIIPNVNNLNIVGKNIIELLLSRN